MIEKLGSDRRRLVEKFNSPAPEWSEVGVENGEYAGLTHVVTITMRVVTRRDTWCSVRATLWKGNSRTMIYAGAKVDLPDTGGDAF